MVAVVGSRSHALSGGLARGPAVEVARVVARGVGGLWDHGERVRARRIASCVSSVHAQRSHNEVINAEGRGPLAQRGEALLPCGDLLLTVSP